MRPARIGPHEDQRLAALAEYALPEGEVDAGLTVLTDLARRLFDVPIALVTLVAESRIVFGGNSGMDVCGAPREIGFCAHALTSDDLLVVPDTRLDPRFAGNPLVTGPDPMLFYAGVPLRTHAGHILGTLCLIDRQPRPNLPARDRQTLRDLGALALEALEARRLAQARVAGQHRFRHIAATSPDAIVCADRNGIIRFWNPTAERLFGYSAVEAVGQPLTLIVPQRHAAGHAAGLRRVAAGGAPTIVGRTVELTALHRDGHELPIELSLSSWQEDGEASFGAIMRDISRRRADAARLFHLAAHDPLTGLPNRTVLFERIEQGIATGEAFHLLVVGLDGFKPVNDTAGHQVGDGVLKDVAARLIGCIADPGSVARIGGDQFAVLLPARAGGDPGGTADRIIAALEAPFRLGDGLAHLGGSVGIASVPDHAASAIDLVSAADLAMHQAKREGRRCRRIFHPDLRNHAIARRDQEQDLRHAIDRGEFELFFQPQVRLSDEAVIGAEALIRWNHPDRGLLLPDQFLPAVEQGLLAVEIGTWVLQAACARAVAWRRRLPGFRMGVNLFGAQFGTGRLADQVRHALRSAGLDPAGLELEVTENVILRHDATMLDALQMLHAEGVGIAFDDFGTGFASLSMLKTYPLTRLKIDRGFVRDILANPVDALIVGAVAAMGTGLDIDVIAEGIEDEAQRAMLHASGCHSGQGYLFGRPMPAAAFERWLDTRTAATGQEDARCA